MSSILIYGANGFTGRLIASNTHERKLPVILSGRHADSIRSLSEKQGCPYRVFSVDRPDLSGATVLLNCAGPFTRTAPSMMRSCIAEKVHYLDITGEISVFEEAYRLDREARSAGVCLIPGVGFDVVPTDCLASTLKLQMPDATHLELGIFSKASLSRGTAITMIENIPAGGKERVNGELIPVPLFHKTKRIRFLSREVSCAAIPWGDLATAFYSTEIPNIIVYASNPPAFVRLARIVEPFRRALALPLMQKLLKGLVEKTINGPGLEEQARSRVELWGRVSGPSGEREIRASVPEGYRFTSELAVECAERMLKANLAGYHTPSQAFGAEFLGSLPGVEIVA